MAMVRVKSKDEIPEGAIIMSKKRALEEQMKMVQEWPSTYEKWPLEFGSTILGVTSVLSSVYVNNHFRRKLKLLNFNKFTSYLPTVVIPTIITTLFHTNFITTRVVLQDYECPSCLQTRAMTIQVGFGALYPCILGPISSFMLATRNYTFRLPAITENPLELLRIAKKMFKPIHGQIAGFAVLNAFVAAFITYKEIDAYFFMQDKILEGSKKLQKEIQ